MMLERHRSKLNIKNNKSICNKIQSIHIKTMFLYGQHISFNVLLYSNIIFYLI